MQRNNFWAIAFSDRRGSEGMHSIKDGKTIDESTKLYNPNDNNDFSKTSSYIYNAFLGSHNLEIEENLKENISYIDLLEMLTFDRAEFEKDFSTSAKKKVKIESKYEIKKLGELVENFDNKRIPLSKSAREKGVYPYYGATGIIDYVNDFIFDEKLILIGEDGAKWGANENSAFIVEGKYWVNNHAHVIKPNRELILDKFLVEILNKFDLSEYISGLSVPKLNQANLNLIQIPLPPLDIQQKIVEECAVVESNILEKAQNIEDYNFQLKALFHQSDIVWLIVLSIRLRFAVHSAVAKLRRQGLVN